MKQQLNLKLDPVKFYGLVKIIKTFDKTREVEEGNYCFAGYNLRDKVQSLAIANNNLLQEIRLATKNSDPFKSFEDQEYDAAKFDNTLSGKNFLRIAFEIVNHLNNANKILLEACNNFIPGPILVETENFDSTKLSFEKIQQVTFESELNRANVERFVNACIAFDEAPKGILAIGDSIAKLLNNYYRSLYKRHTEDGVKIFRDPVITDIAISIFENIDAHGEIASGKKPDELSAYSMRKAEVIISSVRSNTIYSFINQPEAFVKFIEKEYQELWASTISMREALFPTIQAVFALLREKPAMVNENEFYAALQLIKDANPHAITPKDSTKMFSSEERFNLQFQNETLEKLVGMLVAQAPVLDIIKYILGRKAELRKFFQDENSFYVCRIGGGNAFLGEAPGALNVVPGVRPNAKLDDIVGSGFSEVKSFVRSIEAAAKWHDLFLATSPSKTADKSNVLLIGPPGCGKSEVLRCVGADSGSIGIFAQGSDFLTCWKGEAEKNPKRLFEAALKIQKESGKHVHILIDEIDSVLKKKEFTSHTDVDLTLEFQMLMDGVVHYPGLTVWGTTNHPERIPMPMIRRFSRVLIVGELDISNRIKLLKHFTDFLPVSDSIAEKDWENFAKKLEGATGDVVRKVVDHIWREKVTDFVCNNSKEASQMVDYLIEQNEGNKFDIAKFDDKMRQAFKNKLRSHLKIGSKDIEGSIDLHLKNVGVYNEIEEAKKTYKQAKEFLASLDAGGI